MNFLNIHFPQIESNQIKTDTPSNHGFTLDVADRTAKDWIAERERVQRVETPLVTKPPTLEEILRQGKQDVTKGLGIDELS